MARRIAFAVALLFGLSQPTFADSDKQIDFADELIHSDVPLYYGGSSEIWPSNFYDEDGSFGCTSRVAFGDWQFEGEGNEAIWWRLENYGVFHCALVEHRSDDREELTSGEFHYSFVVRIGEVRQQGKTIELWVLQSGSRPGSQYTLLSREPGEGMIRSFTILQRDCPKSRLRGDRPLDIWQTRYCSINSPRDLLMLAKRMAKLPPLGTLEWKFKSAQDEAED